MRWDCYCLNKSLETSASLEPCQALNLISSGLTIKRNSPEEASCSFASASAIGRRDFVRFQAIKKTIWNCLKIWFSLFTDRKPIEIASKQQQSHLTHSNRNLRFVTEMNRIVGTTDVRFELPFELALSYLSLEDRLKTREPSHLGSTTESTASKWRSSAFRNAHWASSWKIINWSAVQSPVTSFSQPNSPRSSMLSAPLRSSSEWNHAQTFNWFGQLKNSSSLIFTRMMIK